MTTLTPTLAHDAPHVAKPAQPGILRQAIRPALQWRLMLLWLIGLLLPALVATLPLWSMFGAAFNRNVHVWTLARRLDLVAIADLGNIMPQYSTALIGGGVVALVLTLLLSPLLTGAAITAARAPTPPGFAALAAGGVREYGRLLRMMLWALAPLGLAVFLGGIAAGAADQHAADAVLESSATNAGMLAAAIAGLLLLLAHATVDAGRAMLALDLRRRSALLAWIDGVKLLARRPLATLGLCFGVTLFGLALAALLAVARLNLPALSGFSFIGGLLLAQLAVLVLAWTRCVRLFGLMALAR